MIGLQILFFLWVEELGFILFYLQALLFIVIYYESKCWC